MAINVRMFVSITKLAKRPPFQAFSDTVYHRFVILRAVTFPMLPTALDFNFWNKSGLLETDSIDRLVKEKIETKERSPNVSSGVRNIARLR